MHKIATVALLFVLVLACPAGGDDPEIYEDVAPVSLEELLSGEWYLLVDQVWEHAGQPIAPGTIIDTLAKDICLDASSYASVPRDGADVIRFTVLSDGDRLYFEHEVVTDFTDFTGRNRLRPFGPAYRVDLKPPEIEFDMSFSDESGICGSDVAYLLQSHGRVLLWATPKGPRAEITTMAFGSTSVRSVRGTLRRKRSD